MWWHWKDDGAVEFYDGPNEATHCPEGPSVCHFRSSSIKAVQSSLRETAWKQCYKKPDELPLYKLRSDSGKLVYDKFHEEGFSSAEDNEPEGTFLNETQHGNICRYEIIALEEIINSSHFSSIYLSSKLKILSTQSPSHLKGTDQNKHATIHVAV